MRDFVRSLTQAARVGARLMVPGDASWPSGVDELGVHAPIGLWVRGRSDALDGSVPTIALVGARAATGYGEHVAMESSAGLVDRGFAIVSGGAYGIDGMAHRAALASDGTTIAFLAGGVDRFYPLGHESLLSRIAQTGARRLRTAVRCRAHEVAIPATQSPDRGGERGDRGARGGHPLRLAQHGGTCRRARQAAREPCPVP